MKIKLLVTGYDIDKDDMCYPAKITLNCQIKRTDGERLTPLDELKGIDKLLEILNNEGIEIDDTDLYTVNYSE